MKPMIIAVMTALLLVAAHGLAHAQRGWSNPYPQYPQSPPGGGYFTDGRGAAGPETRPLQLCPPGRTQRVIC